MKYRTFRKREGRFYRLQILQYKRAQYFFIRTRSDGSVWFTFSTDKMMKQKESARRLYHEAYTAIYGIPPYRWHNVRKTLERKYFAADAKGVPPGRSYDVMYRGNPND